MVLTASTMMALETLAPEIGLVDVVSGGMVSLASLGSSDPLLVMFMCCHCPFVKHIQAQLAQLGQDYQGTDLAIVAISSNDIEQYPADAPEKLKEMALGLGFTFPVCFDADQLVAKAYTAACTPDFFLFGRDRRLVYRGQLDDSRPGNDLPVTGSDLRAAVDAVLAAQPVSESQKPSIGCNIKWKPGAEPDYFG
ncbi:MAG: thioredoxin family protein [Merismopedia sp. SIO2A8]|nr:thioredoxin family protein [Symploca sp. SIO2B6]NET48138.1 thioredoxin family protein [Merismopedia sp. SIO2A8]